MRIFRNFRLFELWQIFSDGKAHRARVLALQLSVSAKTINRDVEALRDLGCDFTSNRNGDPIRGWRLVKVVCPCCGQEKKP